ncbi:MAG TPA: hypothetical protein VMT17_07120 [Anaeromyxobacteraceae bacterium]|nr:hypothetical protein [Anaeromyxobacteraceae bacterium]
MRRLPSGWPALAAGLSFSAAGLGLLWAAAGRRLDAPPALLAVFAAAFLGGGILVAVYGWRGAARARLVAMHPAEPWRFDRAWDPGGALDETGKEARTALAQAIGAAAFLLPFHALFALEPEGVPVLALAVFDLVPVLLLGRAAHLRLRRRKYGTSRLRFERFPYFLGETFAATLVLGQRAPLVRALEVTLSCEESRPPEPEAGDPARHGWTEVELYRATQVTRGARSLGVRFELPAGTRPLGTDLTGPVPRRWWLRVRGKAPGIDYAAAFPVPIYAPPGG